LRVVSDGQQAAGAGLARQAPAQPTSARRLADLEKSHDGTSAPALCSDPLRAVPRLVPVPTLLPLRLLSDVPIRSQVVLMDTRACRSRRTVGSGNSAVYSDSSTRRKHDTCQRQGMRMSGTCSALPEVEQDTREPQTLMIVLLVSIVFVSRLLGVYVRHIYDDAFVTFRYAANLAAGNGFVYSIGERMLGTTSPLWGLILTPLAWAHVSPSAVVPILDALLDCVVALLVLMHGRRHHWMLPAVLFAVMFVGDPNMVRISVGGMETSLLLVLNVAALMLFEDGRRVTAAVVAAVCYFLRPESLLLLILLLSLTARQRRWRDLAVMTSSSVVAIVIPLGFI